MNTRRTLSVLIAVVSALALAPLCEAALPGDDGLEQIPVQGAVSPDGSFVGIMTITAVAGGDVGQLLLTGVLSGTTTHCTGAKILVRRQAFTAPATLMDADRTTDVLLLTMAPIALASVGGRLTLAPIPLDIDAVPGEGQVLATLLNNR